MVSQTRSTTSQTYLRIWRQFNQFLIRLDKRPEKWEDRIHLFIGYKIEQGMQSSSVKTYVSAIKKTLITDGYQWEDKSMLLSSLTKACKIINDKLYTRLPISDNLLELILFEIQRIFNDQVFLELLYKALFSLSYYGMLGVCEVTQTGSNHAVRACNVHAALNKRKILLILYTSKTHGGGGQYPQKIKISANDNCSQYFSNRYFCPFKLTNDYLRIRGAFRDRNKQFFIFSDRLPVTAQNASTVLRQAITGIGLEVSSYGMHSFCIGRTSDLINKFHKSLEEVTRAGRWKSSAVYRYIKN